MILLPIHIAAWFACFFFFKSALRRIFAWVVIQGVLFWPGSTIYCSTVGGGMCRDWGGLWFFALPMMIGIPGLIIFALTGYIKSYKGLSKRVRYFTLPLMALIVIVPAYPVVKHLVITMWEKSDQRQFEDAKKQVEKIPLEQIEPRCSQLLNNTYYKTFWDGPRNSASSERNFVEACTEHGVRTKINTAVDIKSCQETYLYMKQLTLSKYGRLGLEGDVIRCLKRNKLYSYSFDQKIQICGTLDHSLNAFCLYTAKIIADLHTVDDCEKYLADDSNPMPQIYCTAYIQSKNNIPSTEEVAKYCKSFKPIDNSNFPFDECVRSFAINSGNQEICSLFQYDFTITKCKEDAQKKTPYEIESSDLW